MGVKFKLFSPLCHKLLNDNTHCGTKCVEQYYNEFESCIVNVKSENSMFSVKWTAGDKVNGKQVVEEEEVVVSEDREDVNSAEMFDLNWQPRTKHQQVGRLKVSEVAFKEKKEEGNNRKRKK